MPRVLWLCEYPELHGAEQSLLANVELLMEAGWSITACAPPRGPLADELSLAGIELIPLPEIAGADEAARERRREALSQIIAEARPDLVHANSLAMGRLSGPVVERLGVPSLAHLRDIVGLSRAAVTDLNRHARLIAVSRATARYHAAQGLDARKLYTLYNGVSLDRFAPRPKTGKWHARLALPAEATLIGTIGQVGLRKGHDLLWEALAPVLADFPQTHLLIAGARTSDKQESREFERALRDRAACQPLAGHVHWLGVVREIPELLNELTVLVHPARQEPLGRVLLEAAASGCAIVATDVGGTREIFPPRSHAARIVPPGDALAMTAALIELLRSAGLRRQLSQGSRRRAEARFDIRRSARGLLGHYSKAVNHHRGTDDTQKDERKQD